MKVLAILLCAFVAVQGRSAVSNTDTRSLALLGENPFFVHLRIAVSTSGLLNTAAGSLIGTEWVLTTKSSVAEARFVWIRYGVVNVINPSLVTETSAVLLNEIANIALVKINRIIQVTANIAPVANLGQASEGAYKFYGFGSATKGGPGEVLTYSEINLTESDEGLLIGTSEEGVAATEFDLGAPLISGESQVGILVGVKDGVAEFLPSSVFVDWVESETGLSLTEESNRVNFIN